MWHGYFGRASVYRTFLSNTHVWWEWIDKIIIMGVDASVAIIHCSLKLPFYFSNFPGKIFFINMLITPSSRIVKI